MVRTMFVCLGLVGCGAGHLDPFTPRAAYDRLVDAGCAVADPVGGPQYVADWMATPNAPAWVSCFVDGGTTGSCDVPCPLPPTR